MAAKNPGTLIKEARTAAGLTQAQLADKVGSITAQDISKAERGEKELSQAALKLIAKACGVTQASLLAAAGNSGKTSGKTSSKTSGKNGKTAAKTSGKTASKDSDALKLTAAEKKLVELYRAADSDTKKTVMKTLKGESNEAAEILGTLLSSMVGNLGKK